VCHTPTARAAEDCPSCGLLFRSRVPPALRSLPDYHVLRPLGAGGMSSIYLAYEPGQERLCVLKTLASVDEQSDPAWHAEAARCLRQEYELLRQLDHPNIARVLGWRSTAAGDFLVLEYVPGLTLEQRLSRPDGSGGTLPGKPQPVKEVLAYGRIIAKVLDYLARLPQPVLHHDIKPGNLIVRPEDRRLVLVDFGSAVLMPRPEGGNGPTMRLDCYGTPGYAAPEQYRGSFSPRSDIYGLGATLYHLLTDDDPTAHPLQFPALGHLPPPVAAVLAPTLAQDPAARPDAHQLYLQLLQLLNVIG
jgi:serine/threonine-protein kinase